MIVEALGGDMIGPDGNFIPISPGMRCGSLIMLSGQLALRDGAIVGETIEEQSDIAIDNILALLTPLGRSLQDVVKVTTWLTRSTDFVGFNSVYARRFNRPFPARSTVVSSLLLPGALVEIEAIAVAE